ncbi:MAG TPA: lipopolysaccharide kinase InaA family protein [Acidimicrobiales bacterium]|nr:lipopolysaccharide kinase InaA family protein [Acidimicrobiales bacterium]
MATNSDPGATATVVRSPADVLRLVVAVATLLLVLLVGALFEDAVVGFAHDLLQGLEAFGERLLTAAVVIARVAAVVLLAAGLVVALIRGRWRILASVTVAAGAGAAVFALLDRLFDVQQASPVTLSDSAGLLSGAGFPTAVGLAIAAAVVTAAGPWLPRRYRRLGWAVVLVLMAARFVAAPVSGASVAAVVAGWAGGALAVVLLGAPSWRPGKDAVIDGLRSVGLDVATLEPAAVDARGSTPYFGTAAGGGGLFVKVLGRDERDADLLFRLYRTVVPRDLGDERPFSSLRRAVEHEALVALAADGMGVRTPAVAAFSNADPGGYVLAYEAVDGRSLDRVAGDELTDDVLDRVWEQVANLRRHRVAHRDLRLANVFLDRSGQVWMIDFGFAELAASDLLLATDLAELTASLSLKVGPQRAVAAGRRAVGGDALSSALPRLKTGFLSGATRSGIKEAPALLDELRSEIGGGQPLAGAHRPVGQG